MGISGKLKSRILRLLSYRTVNGLLTLKYRNRHAGLSEGACPIIVSGSQRSGTTFLAENIAAATRARLLFEPLAMSVTYRRTRALARPQVLPFSDELQEGLDWLLTARLPYNHSVDAITPGGHYRRRLVKDLRLGFALPDLAAARPDLPFIHIVRHPLDAIRSHLKLYIRTDHRALASGNVRRILRDRHVVERYPWLKSLDIDHDDAAELELIEWCVENSAPATCEPRPNLAVVGYEDIISTKTIPDEVWETIARSGIEIDTEKVDLRRPSKTTNASELETVRKGQPMSKYRDYFDDRKVARAREILEAAGLMDDSRTTVFGHEIV